jgi:hypothetical protein
MLVNPYSYAAKSISIEALYLKFATCWEESLVVCNIYPKLLDPLTLAGFYILETETLYRPVCSRTLSRDILRTYSLKEQETADNDLTDKDLQARV